MAQKKQPRPAAQQRGPAPTPSRLQRASTPVLLRLHRAPRWLLPVLTAVLMFGGLFTSNAVISALLFALLGVFLAWLVALSWNLLTPGARLMRLAVIGSIAFVVVSRLRG